MNPKLAIGIDVGGTFIKAGLVNRRGQVIARIREETGVGEGLENQVLPKILSVVHRLEQFTGRRGEIAGVGLGIAGLIHLRQGRVLTSPNISGWQNFPLRKSLVKRINVPVFLENDANAAALGEKWVGAARNTKTFCFLTLGTGVGGGLVFEGKIWHGADGLAGEVGHMTIHPDGARCNCGNRGCLEAYASLTALRRMVWEAIASGKKTRLSMDSREDSLSGESVYQAAQKGDRLARAVFQRMGSNLGLGIANLINLLNPEMVVLGGGLSAAWKFFIPALRLELKNRAFAASAKEVRIVRATAGEDAGILGAAYIVWQGLEVIT